MATRIVATVSNAILAQAQAYAEIISHADREYQVERAQLSLTMERHRTEAFQLDVKNKELQEQLNGLLKQTKTQEEEIERLNKIINELKDSDEP